jgi:UDPglucose 6-dehydrogenase
MADKLVELSYKHKLPIVIHGKAYKPYVPYVDGSYSLLVGHYIEQAGLDVAYADPLTDDFWKGPAVILLAHNPAVTYEGTGVEIKPDQFYFYIEPESVILDPWRTITCIEGCEIIHYGNTRSK